MEQMQLFPTNVAKGLPRLITKQRLRQIFSIDDEENSCTSYLLRKYFFTDAILSELKLTEEQYDKITIFPPDLTQRIYILFQISPEEIKK